MVLALTLTLVLVLTLALAPSGMINKKGMIIKKFGVQILTLILTFKLVLNWFKTPFKCYFQVI